MLIRSLRNVLAISNAVVSGVRNPLILYFKTHPDMCLIIATSFGCLSIAVQTDASLLLKRLVSHNLLMEESLEANN